MARGHSRLTADSMTEHRMTNRPSSERKPSLRGQLLATLSVVVIVSLLLGLGAVCGIDELG